MFEGNQAGCCCGPDQFVWVNANYLLWRVREAQVPPLLTSGSPLDSRPGALGQPGTLLLDGGGEDDLGWHSGLRVSTGVWLFDRWGLEGSFLFLGSHSSQGSASSNGNELLAVPFVDVNGGEEAHIIGSEIQAAHASSRLSNRLLGFEANVLRSGCDRCGGGVTWFAGFRYLELDEALGFDTQSTLLVAADESPADTTIATADDFSTRNLFYGTQVGARYDCQFGRVSLNATAKAALGPIEQIVNISGSTATTAPGSAAIITKSGLLAQPSNVGRYSRVDLCVAPEADVNLDFMITHSVHALVGYSFLYITDVVRPGDQVDRTSNANQISGGNGGGSPQPTYLRHTTDFWAQGINLGLELRY